MNRQPKRYDFTFTHRGANYFIGWEDTDSDEVACYRQNPVSKAWDTKIAYGPGIIEDADAGRKTVEEGMNDFLESLAVKLFGEDQGNELPSSVEPGSNVEQLLLLIRDDLVYSSDGNGSVTY